MLKGNRTIVCIGLGFSALLLVAGESRFAAQDEATHLRVTVNLVQLNVAVTDSKGNYISGLKPENFEITEDKIPQRIATFEEGNGPAIRPSQNVESPTPSEPGGAAPAATSGATPAEAPDEASNAASDRISGAEMASSIAGANIFILFDTSNYMYRGFVYAQDAISDFVRSMDIDFTLLV